MAWVSLFELEPLLGKDMTKVLTKHIGGVSTYIPYAAQPDHQIAKLVGIAGMKALCSKYGKSWITVPNGKHDEPFKERILKLLEEATMSRAAIAQEVGVTERYVYRLAKLGPRQQQLTLFD